MGYCIVGMFQQSICAILLLPLTIPKGYLLFIIQTILSAPFNPNKEAQKTAKMSAPSRPTFPNLFDFYVSRISHFFGASCFPLFPIICAFYYRAASRRSCFLSTGQNPSIRIRKPLVLHTFSHYRTLTSPQAASKLMAQIFSSPLSTQ